MLPTATVSGIVDRPGVGTLPSFESYARNWARYWREAMLFPVEDVRLQVLMRPVLEQWLTEQLGAIAPRHLGDPQFDLPEFISIGSGPSSENIGGGLLGAAYDPFVLGQAGQLPDNSRVPVATDRLQRRLSLLDDLQQDFSEQEGRTFVADQRSLYQRAARLVLSTRLRAFDLAEEPDAMRDAYGRHPFWQGCLLARRLVEAGVTFIKVRTTGRWDTHQSNFADLFHSMASGLGINPQHEHISPLGRPIKVVDGGEAITELFRS
jgi:hypothetical protein